MSEEKELKLQYWRMAVLCAMEWVNSSSGQPYSDKPIAPARLEKLIVSWGVTADRSTLEVIMGDLKLLHFEEKSSAYAAPRYVPNDTLTEFMGDVKGCFDQMAIENGLETLWDSFRRFGTEWVIESLENIGDLSDVLSYKDSAENSDAEDIETDEWAPLPLDYDSEDAEPAIQALKAAKEAIEQENGYTANFPAERDSIVSSLQSAIGLMKVRGEYTRIYFIFAVVEPLKKAASRLGDSASGKTVDAAIKGVQKWITENVYEALSRWLG